MKTIHHILRLLLGLCLSAAGLMAQQDGLVSPVYGWHSYTSHKRVLEVSVLGDSAYAITTGGLIRHNFLTQENVLFSPVEGLSSVDPTAVLADPGSRKVFVGYADGTINYFDPDGQLHVVTDIARTDQFTSKRINHLAVRAGLLYLATDFGIVVYDIAARETKYSVTKIANNQTGSYVNAVTMAQGRIWISMETLGLWSADALTASTTLPDVWRKETGLNGLPIGRNSFVCYQNDLLFAQVGDTIFQKAPGQPWIHSNFPVGSYNYLNAAEGRVFGTFRPWNFAILYPDSNLIIAQNFGRISCVAVSKFGDALIGDSLAGLQSLRFGIGLSSIGPDCPKNNNVADMAAYDGELYVAPKGRSGSSARAYDKSGIPFYDLHNGGWHISDHIDGPLTDVYQDFYRTTIDSVTGRAVIGSWGEGIVEMQHGELVRSYNQGNSGLHAGISGHLVSGLAFDPTGNLWITQGLNDKPLQCLTPDGQWYSYSSPYSLNAYGLTIDDLGNKWMINYSQGIVVFNDNYTPANTADDHWRVVTGDFGQGGLPNNTVNCIAQDHDLQIWIGTIEGVTIMYDPSLLFTSDFQDAACPLIEGYCLFRDQQVNDIAVDGYNRKWIATENGVFLVNLDGTELLTHFTEANSPLLDDDVKSIAIDPQTGEVFFGTAKGIVSYIGDAIDGQADAETLYSYPNPAFVDQTTPVMIKGMRKFSKVKIATASGRVVRELDSQGGEVPWDLHDAFGNRIPPGIYLVMVSDPDGKGAGITKIAVLEKQN